MGVNNDGLRQNLKMSDLRTAFAPPSTTAIAYSDICTWTAAPNNYIYTGTTIGSGYRSREYYLEGEYYYSTSNLADVIDKPFIMQTFYGRYKTSTSATPTTLTHVTSTDTGTGSTYSGRTLTNKNVKMSNYVGLSQCPLTTDTCGQTRGVKNGYTLAVTVTSPGGGGFQNQAARDAHSGTNAVYSGKEIAYGLTDTNIGMSVVRTYYTNQWSDIGLNTICAEGDRVVVVATSTGGTMYTFSTTDPIYLRTTGNSAVSATITTHYGPTKNETGSDTWMAVYSAVCNAGGAARVGINPYHSGNGNYIFYIFVIKGPESTLTAGGSLVYTQQSTTPTFLNHSTNVGWQYPSMQPYVISIVASPFVGNGHSGALSAIVTKNLLCVAQTPISTFDTGAGFVSVSGHGAGAGIYNTGKYSSDAPSAYTPQYAVKVPRQDARSIIIHGSRGHHFGT